MRVHKFVSGLLFVAAMAMPSGAKPMPSPSLQDASTSELIVLASYKGFRPFRTPVTYFDGVMAQYRITRVLRGAKPADSDINVAYAFHDGSACLADKNWSFSEATTMPKKDSQWILFLNAPKFKSSVENAFTTYRGDFGRMAATPENISNVQHLISR